nr:39S ribosomal protein L21 mitochondrial [Hymenolepis microstoma]
MTYKLDAKDLSTVVLTDGFKLSFRNIHTSYNLFDWIRRNTPRKPYRHKIDRVQSVLEEERIVVELDKHISKKDLAAADLLIYNEVRTNVAKSLALNNSRNFAVIHFAAPLLEAQPGEIIRFEKVLLAGNSDFTIVGRPILPRNNVLVTAMVVEKTLQHPSLWYQFHRRRRHRVMRVFQDNLVTLRIVDVCIENL